MAERLMAADCKSAAPCVLRGFESLSAHHQQGTSAHVAQLVEHVLGKDGVSSSNLLVGSSEILSGVSLLRSLSGSNSGVESQPSKLLVAGSNPVSRSNHRTTGKVERARCLEN